MQKEMVHCELLEESLGSDFRVRTACSIPREEKLPVEQPIEHLTKPEEDFVLVDGTNSCGTFGHSERHAFLEWLKMFVVAHETTGHCQLAVWNGRAVEQVELLVREFVLPLNPPGDHMFIGAVLVPESATTKKAGREPELSL
ncbi:MAG: hypothetical protein IID38_08150 [Planctomycetes bacterium]|nr:hypothetical protein [Planctomycetota bacterium]